MSAQSRVLLVIGTNEIGVRWSGDGCEGELAITGPFALCMTDRPPPSDVDGPLQELLHDEGTWLLHEVEERPALVYQDALLASRPPGAFALGDEFACFELWATWHRHPQPQAHAPLALLLWERIFTDPAWSMSAPSPCESELVIVVPLSAPLLFAREICRSAESYGFHVTSVRHDLDAIVAGLQLRRCSGRVRVPHGHAGFSDWIVSFDAATPEVSVAPDDGHGVVEVEDARERTLGLLASAWQWWHAARPDALGVGPAGTVLGIRIGDGDEEDTESNRSTGILWTSMGLFGGEVSDIPNVTLHAKLELPDHDMRVRMHLVHGVPGMPAAGACSLWRTDPSAGRGADEALRFRLSRLEDAPGCSIEVSGLPRGLIERRVAWDPYGMSLASAAARLGPISPIRAARVAPDRRSETSVGYDLRTGAVALRRTSRAGSVVRWRGRIGTLLVQEDSDDLPCLAMTWSVREAEGRLSELLAVRGGAGTARRHAWAVSLREAMIDAGAPVPASRGQLAVVVPYTFSLEMYGTLQSCLRASGWERVELLFRHEAAALGAAQDACNVRLRDWSISVTRTVEAGVTRLSGPTSPDPASIDVEVDGDQIKGVLSGALAALAAPQLTREHRVEGLVFVHGDLFHVLPQENGQRRVVRLRSASRTAEVPLILRLGSTDDAQWIIGTPIKWPVEGSQLVMVGVRKGDGTAGVRTVAPNGDVQDHLVPRDLLA